MNKFKINIGSFFYIDNEEDRLKYFFDVLRVSVPCSLNNDDNFEKFQLVWRENIIGIKYVDDLKFLLNEITVHTSVKEHGNIMNRINYFGESFYGAI